MSGVTKKTKVWSEVSDMTVGFDEVRFVEIVDFDCIGP